MSTVSINTKVDQIAGNIGKMGAYYTDIGHCKSLSTFFHMPEDEEVSVIEPSIGDGSAVIAATNAEYNPKIKIFGVELNDTVAEQTKCNPYIEACIKTDFLNGVRIKNSVFSFCFGNPPYIDERLSSDDRGRQELSFLKKVTNYLIRDAVIVWIVPHRVFIEDSFLRFWLSRFDTLGIYRFRPEEYKKYSPIALIGRKTRINALDKDYIESFKKQYYSAELIDELPLIWEGEKIEVMPSPSDAVTLFGTIDFDAEDAASFLTNRGCELDDSFSKMVGIPDFSVSDIGRPPIPPPPKNDSMYLLAVCGVGSGKAGKEGEDLHLQRGITEVVEEKVTETETENGKPKVIEKCVSRTQIKMTIIQENGTINRLI